MSWTRPSTKGVPPTARWGHTTTLVTSSNGGNPDHKLVVFGGHDGTKMLNDVHVLDVATFTWTQPAPATKNADGTPASGPSARAGHTATLVSGKRLLMFGGGDGTKILNDTWILDMTQLSQSVAASSNPVGGNSSTSTSSPNQSPNLLWVKITVTGTAPPSRCAHTSTLIESKMIVFGGGDGSRRFKDLYILDIGN